MFRFPVARSAAVAIAATLAIAAAPSALAKEPKATVITVSASMLKDADGRMCMPKSVLPKPVDKSLPATICQTRDAWAASGVTFVAR